MPCPECARLEARVVDLLQLHSRARAEHLKNPKFNKVAGHSHLEEAMFSDSEATKRALERLIEHRMECG
jgi:hypothetical protein